MANTLLDDQSTAFSAAAAFDDSTQRAEWAATDDNSSPATAPAFFVKIIDAASVAFIVHVPADSTFVKEWSRGRADNWTWQAAAVSGTADIVLMED